MENDGAVKVLDLGCGSGFDLANRGVKESDDVVACDPLPLYIARSKFPARRFVQARAEALPFRASEFESVICRMSLPYMDIPKALCEVRRILRPRGRLFTSVHPLPFTVSELRKATTLKALLYRCFVILNGFWFYLTGKTLSVAGRSESFQTVRGMRLALKRAGLKIVFISRPDGVFGKRLWIEAEK